ncbi:MAG TPA: sodium-translocating pyrophosphatase [Candidatus Cloacimonadota bacterium]|nr:sodium-translocating pyrophosphatase [Candidatus Cloacimonadota bacterium]
MPNLPIIWYLAPFGAISALCFAYFFYRRAKAQNPGNARMQEIAGYVREGAYAYLMQQYKGVGIFFVVALAIFLFLAYALKVLDPMIPWGFLSGGIMSGLAGFIGMNTATMASSRTAQACSESLNKGLKVAFRAGGVMGLTVVGLALLDMSAWFYILNAFGYSLEKIAVVMLSFGMGASTQALFARLGGGIYTKAADVGADLVGKVEADIPEDDPRNPATIADNVGDNVGDVAGMGADLYESYAGSVLATAALGMSAVLQLSASNPAVYKMMFNFISAPLILAGIGALLSIFGIFIVSTREDAHMRELMAALNKSVYVSSILIAIASFFITRALLGEYYLGIFFSSLVGLLAGILIGHTTELWTSHSYSATKNIAKQGEYGSATVILEGISVGMLSTAAPVIIIVMGIMIAFTVSGGFGNVELGLYGIGFGAVGMLATLGVTLAMDAFGPIADNAGGNAQMAYLPKEVRERTDNLDAVGNTTAAIGKGFAIGSAALTAMALLAAYLEKVRDGFVMLGNKIGETQYLTINYGNFTEKVDAGKASLINFIEYYQINPLNPKFLLGIFVGAMVTYVFSALTIKAVGRAAGMMVKEVRRQFTTMPGILQGKTKPDYARCVRISTIGAQREMILPAIIGILTPVVIGLLFGVAGVLGVLIGGLTTGFVTAVMMNNAGGAWDNAKKYVETGALGGSGSAVHKATIVGDTVGDPFKDTAGPCINILIKLMSMVSIVFGGFIVAYSPKIEALYTPKPKVEIIQELPQLPAVADSNIVIIQY